MSSFRAPGVYHDFATTVRETTFSTGVPAFVGFRAGALDTDEKEDWAALRQHKTSRILRMDASLWPTIREKPREKAPDKPPLLSVSSSSAVSYLGAAVQGFFENGGRQCYLVLPAEGGLADLTTGLEELEETPGFDLICAPDLVRLDDTSIVDAQTQILNFCNTQVGCFAILDAVQRRDSYKPDDYLARLARIIHERRKLLQVSPFGDGAEHGNL